MKNNSPSGNNTGGFKGGLHDGLKNKSPKAVDASHSQFITSRSVNDEATRSGVASTPKTLGPRTA